MTGVELRYRLLGALAIEFDGRPVEIGPPQRRAVLAVLLHEVGRVVSTDRLIEAVWGEDLPAGAMGSLQVHVSHLRRVLRQDVSSPAAILRRGRGYVLDVDADRLDRTLFVAEASAARRAVDAGDWPAAAAHATAALAQWRGPYLADLGDLPWVRAAAAPLQDRHAGVQQDLVVALLGSGDLPAALARSWDALVDQPLTERAAWLRMVALHRSGRTPEALELFRSFAGTLGEELGLDVGPALRDLHSGMLRHDPDLAHWPGRAPRPVPPRASGDPVPSAAVPGVVEPAPDGPAEAGAVEGGEVPEGTDEGDAFVGRIDELATVARALSVPPAGAPGWVALSGAPGIGKTRLAGVAAGAWAAGGGRVLRAACPDDDAVPPWWPVRQLLAALGADPAGVLELPPGTGPDAARFAVYERVRDELLAAVESAPVLLLVDDVQWADRESLRLLTFLVETVVHPRLAGVLTVRDGGMTPALEQLLAAVSRRPRGCHLALGPLSETEVAQLVEGVSGTPVPAVEARTLAERTGGNPFFVSEFARLTEPERARGTTPAAVRSVLRRRLIALPPEVLELLQVASVFGDPLDVTQLAQATGRHVDDVADALDAAADERVLVPTHSGAGYAFAHALLRGEVARGLPALRRQRLHVDAAARLQDVTAPAQVIRRAGHLREAAALADARDVLDAARAAAVVAEEAWQHEAAAAWWATAADAATRLPRPDTELQDSLVASRVRALALAGDGQAVLEALDTALLDAFRAGRTHSVGVLAANLLRVSGAWPWPVYGSDPAPLMATLEALGPALDGDPAAQARVLAVTAIGHCYHPDADVPEQLSSQAIRLAESSGDPDVLVDAVLGRALTYAGVASHAEESIELLREFPPAVDRDGGRDDVLRHNLLTMATLVVGDLEACSAHVRAGARGAELMRMPISRVQLRWAEAALAQWRGHLEQAEQLYAAAEAAHRSTDLQQAGTFELAGLVLRWERGTLADGDGVVATNPVVSTWTTVVVAAAVGGPDADALLAQEVLRSEPQSWTSHGRLALLAHAVADRRLAGPAAALRARLEPLAPYLASMGQIGTIGPIALALARLAHLVGDDDAAARHLVTAESLARRAGGETAVLHCRVVAAELGAPGGPSAGEIEQLLAAVTGRGLRGLAARLHEVG